MNFFVIGLPFITLKAVNILWISYQIGSWRVAFSAIVFWAWGNLLFGTLDNIFSEKQQTIWVLAGINLFILIVSK